MKHAKPNPNKKRFAAAAVAVSTTGSIPIVFANSAHADAPAPSVAKAGGDVTAPATACEDYIVNRGDNLSTIAARYGVPLADLEAINPGIIAGARPDDYSLIFRGGHVHLPDGKCTPVATVPVPPVGKHGHRWHKPVHVYYRDCTEAPAGLHRGQPGYRAALDGDGDGKACEGPWPPVVTPPPDTTPPPVVTPPSGGSTITPAIAPDCPGTVSGYCAHSVSFWAPLIEQAKSLVGVNYSTSQIESLMSAESSGDPNAINNYDSNAQNGDPSRGLMQTIGATFNAYHVSGTSTNIYDPLANIAAALSYIKDVYGYVPNSPY